MEKYFILEDGTVSKTTFTPQRGDLVLINHKKYKVTQVIFDKDMDAVMFQLEEKD